MYKVTALKHRSVSQRCLKPSLVNSSVNRQRNLDREPSASEILHDKDFGLLFYICI